MVFEQLLQQVADARARAVQAAQAAQAARTQMREENDRWVTGGVNWSGFSLESLIRMVANKSSPAQLEALAGEWVTHGGAVSKASDDMRRSLTKLLQFWGGTAADEAAQRVMINARWIGELGSTATEMAEPIRDAAGALRSAQSTMPGMPKNNWLSTAGGGAAAGFAVAGPVGAAFGAAIGGIASAFGFGNKKKKMKRKAVQTMQRFEDALLGIDSITPQFPGPETGINPGDPTGPRPTPPIDRPGVPVVPPGGGVAGPRPPTEGNYVTDPSFAFGPDSRWQSLTGLGPGSGAPGLPGVGTGGGGGGGLGLGGLGAFPPGMGGGRPGTAGGGKPGGPGVAGGRPGANTGRGAGRGGVPGGAPVGGGRGNNAGGRGAGRGGATGGAPAGGGRGGSGAGGRGAGAGRGGATGGAPAGGGRGGSGAGGRGAGGRGGAGLPGGPGGAGGRAGDRDYKGRGRFSQAGAMGGQGGAAGTGRRGEEENDGEHRRTVPLEEDLFSSDQKAAPPVIGL